MTTDIKKFKLIANKLHYCTKHHTTFKGSVGCVYCADDTYWKRIEK